MSGVRVDLSWIARALAGGFGESFVEYVRRAYPVEVSLITARGSRELYEQENGCRYVREEY